MRRRFLGLIALRKSCSGNFPIKVVNAASITGVLRKINGGILPDSDEAQKLVTAIGPDQRKLLDDSHKSGVIILAIKHMEAQPLKDFVGTEFTILLMERFYEERRKGMPRRKAILVSDGKIGKAVIASALTAIGGFSALLISDFPILRDFGLITFINMLFALFSALVIMPAVLVLLDRFVHTKQAQNHA